MPLNGGPIPTRVLDDEHQPHRSAVRGGQSLALPIGSPELILEVDDEPLDLDGDDLGCAKEDEIDGLTMGPDCKLDLRPERPMSPRDQRLRERELTGVAQGGRAPREDAQNQVESDGLGDGSQRVDFDPRIADLDPRLG